MKNNTNSGVCVYSQKLNIWFTCSLFLLIAISSCQQKNQSQYNDLSEQEKRSAEHALDGLETRKGLETTLFASDDMLVNPTNMDIDAGGRVWVTEGYNYRPSLNPDNPTKEEGDRILILEDTDGDSKADTSKVFYQGNDINAALGIMVLDRQVIVSRSPNVFVFTDTDGDDKADKKEVLFSGIKGVQHDHGVHAFVFGPDGKLYFNMGNEGQIIKDAEGKIVTDVFGNEVKSGGTPYRQGMVFRCNPDGSEFEVLAHNFRNNYEVAVDSYGTLWQSDNDDDGNKGVRINYVMEYGNYGYTDEVTGAGWRARRTGMAEDIPTRHWHQHDPGSIPNLLQTGAGSPTGIAVYEGELLPDVFRGEMIHADAGPNVIRSYPVETDGAGYTAAIENILKADKDQWFRPSDVTVAPDGSIFIADWYDPGVGGHQMGDQQKGRIFRIAPEGKEYTIPEFDLSSPQGAAKALKSPNMNRRARAWIKLHAWGPEAASALVEIWHAENPRYRARALWLLSKLDRQGIEYINRALGDSNPNIRITGLRAARQLDTDIIPFVKTLVNDSSPRVRREAAIALHHNDSPEAAELWAQLALQYNGNDRWYLESLGIGAAGQWDDFFAAWREKVGNNWKTPAGRDIVWRARAVEVPDMLAKIIKDPSVKDKTRYFRAFHFQESDNKQQALINILEGSLKNQQELNLLALKQMDRTALQQSDIVQRELDKALSAVKGTQEFLDLVEKFELTTENEALFGLMTSYPDSSLGTRASNLLLRHGGEDRIIAALNGNDEKEKQALFKVLGNTSSPESIEMLQALMLDESKELHLRAEATKALGAGWGGEQRLAELVKGGLLPEGLKRAASEALSDSWSGNVKQIGMDLAGGDQSSKTSFPPVAELATRQGEPAKGKALFEQSCQICHKVNGKGVAFGPALSEIGGKLPKEGLYDAIFNPSSGISFGYEGYILTFKNGAKAAGIIQSETETELTLLAPGGNTTTYSTSKITSREQMDESLMPEGLVSELSEQELIDLVAYLASLK